MTTKTATQERTSTEEARPVARYPASSVEESMIPETENVFLQGIFQCRSTEALEASLTYAHFLNTVGLTPENYPVFLRMLEVENHWAVDALIGDRDPFLLLSPVQPNEFIVGRMLSMLTRWQKGGIYHKNLSVILGVLQSVYSSPRDGYRIYPISIANLNAIGKHLDKERGQDYPLNRAILDMLDKLATLEDEGDPDQEEIAIHANAIRNAFFDDHKKMEDVIPPVLLVTVEERVEIPPRKRVAVTGSTKDSKGGPKSRAERHSRSSRK